MISAGPLPATQPWVHGIPLMMQSVLLAAVRGPDGIGKYGPTKMLLRWYRRCILVSAFDREILTTPYDPRGGSFTGPSFVVTASDREDGEIEWEKEMDEILSEYIRQTDGLPHHFQTHLMHALEIVGYKHPDKRIATWFQSAYMRLVWDMHLTGETEEQLDHRLGDKRDQWVEASEPSTRE